MGKRIAGLVLLSGILNANIFIHPKSTHGGLKVGLLMVLALAAVYGVIRFVQAYPATLPLVTVLAIAAVTFCAWHQDALLNPARLSVFFKAFASFVLSGSLIAAGAVIAVLAVVVGADVYQDYIDGVITYSSSMALAVLGILLACGLFFIHYGYVWALRAKAYWGSLRPLTQNGAAE